MLLPMDATAFYHVSHSAAFCSFVAEVRGRSSALARRDLLLRTSYSDHVCRQLSTLPGSLSPAVSPGRPLSLQSLPRGKFCKAVLGGRQGSFFHGSQLIAPPQVG